MARLCLLLLICYCAVVLAKGGSRGGSYSRGGGSHTYPSSHGLSGNSAYAGSHHRASNPHTYPESSGKSGNNPRTSYTQHNGISENHHRTSYTQNNAVHNHYHYSPPQHISYGSQQHPVFVGNPPNYVYVYKNSGSRFDNLLTGLALYNLGRASNSHGYHSHREEYSSTPGEICKLGISKSNGEYEETRIECKIMSSFIWDAARANEPHVSDVTRRVTSNVTRIVSDGNSTVTFQNTTVVEALQAKGNSIQVMPGMKCFMIRISRDSSTLKKNVECGLLQEYASRSLRYNRYSGRSTRVLPLLTVITLLLMLPG